MLNIPDTEIKEGQFNLLLDNFEGPIDLLLVLARSQKVDLSDISISELADQYINFINQYRNIHIEIAADYLVMAAWLTYLKSRLLLPKEEKIDEYFQENPIRWMTHEVSRGENLWDIAKIYDVRLEDLKLVNSKTNNSILSINETLLVPLGDPELSGFIPYQSHIVSEGDTLWSLGRKYGIAPVSYTHLTLPTKQMV